MQDLKKVWMTIPTANNEYKGTDYLRRRITMGLLATYRKIMGPGGKEIWVDSNEFWAPACARFWNMY